MDHASHCPDDATLARLLLGEVHDAEIGRLDAHFLGCSRCAQTVRGMDPRDGLVDTLRSLSRLRAAPCDDDPEVAELLQRLKRLQPGGQAASGAAAVAAAVEAPPQQQLAQYELLELLGQGGMGAVYKARHCKLDKVVALKILPAGKLQDPQAVSRFEREMRAVGKLNHPNIVAAHDAGQVDGAHYLVMELVDGIELGALVKQTGPLRIADACELIRQAALGLQHAHDHGLVHRDIKPANLMLARPENGQPPLVKVLDLGLALLDESPHGGIDELTSTGQVMGTIDYMAPEQGSDTHGVDIRADIYSLGASLFKLLTGRAPFSSGEPEPLMQRLMALATKPAPDVRSLRSDCPAELAALVGRLLSKSPDDRPDSPGAVAELLAPFARGADLTALVSRDWLGSASSASASSDDTHKLVDPATGPLNAGIEHGVLNLPRGVESRHRRLGLALAAGAAAVVLLAGIIITVTHRDGTKTKIEIRSEPANVASKAPDKPAATLSKSRPTRADVAAAAATTDAWPDMPEPPPLDQWLKGREVLTVKQDGAAMFTTIQAALDAQKDGQVVRVLDRGPYRETLDWKRKSNCGLVTDARTVVLQERWRTIPYGGDRERGHFFAELKNCRVCGFDFVSRPGTENHLEPMQLYRVAGLSFEECVVCMGGGTNGCLSVYLQANPAAKAPVCIRDCVLALRLETHTSGGERLLLVRNWLQCANNASVFLVHEAENTPAFVSVRQNVTATTTSGSVWRLRNMLNPLHVRFRRNTALGGTSSLVSLTEPAGPGVAIEDNLHLQGRRTTAAFFNEASTTLAIAQHQWLVARNYGDRESVSEAPYLALAAQGASQPIRMLSNNPLDRNYARVDAASIKVPAGDPFPGALPPGPAPAEGDWFTRLQDRWNEAQILLQQLSATTQ